MNISQEEFENIESSNMTVIDPKKPKLKPALEKKVTSFIAALSEQETIKKLTLNGVTFSTDRDTVDPEYFQGEVEFGCYAWGMDGEPYVREVKKYPFPLNFRIKFIIGKGEEGLLKRAQEEIKTEESCMISYCPKKILIKTEDTEYTFCFENSDEYEKLLLFVYVLLYKRKRLDESTEEQLVLENIIGLEKAKKELEKQVSFICEQYKIENKNLNSNMIFIGNAGTGKRLAAQYFATLCKEKKVTKDTRIITYDCRDTVEDPLEEIERIAAHAAKGGILYLEHFHVGVRINPMALVQMVRKLAQTNQGSMIIILSGYVEGMKKVLKDYPEIESYFSTKIEFPDYSKNELSSIFKQICEKDGITISEDAEKALDKCLVKIISRRGEYWGNVESLHALYRDAIKNMVARMRDAEKQERCLCVSDFIGDDDLMEMDPNEELNELIGLTGIKAKVMEQANLIRMEEERKKRGGKVVARQSRHMVFTGNAGTGKTTVARIIARIYYKYGIISNPKVVEVDRATLVGQYIGHTEKNTLEKIEQAKGGILFVDEAYALAGRKGMVRDFGEEAITTILKAMEDMRDDLIVIVAGYKNEMEEFISSNEGLRSRFPIYIDFPDYSASEMVRIFLYFCNKDGYEVDINAMDSLQESMQKLEGTKGKGFGNARSVRNQYEQVQRNMANRLAKLMQEGANADSLDFTTIMAEDI